MVLRKLLFCGLIIGLLAGVLPLSQDSAYSQDSPTLPPEVIDVYPFPGSEMIGDEPLTITFNQAMDRASVEQSIRFDPALQGTFTWTDTRTVDFTPVDAWSDPVYTLSIDTGARSGQQTQMSQDYQTRILGLSSFTVTEFSPAADAESVPLDSQIVVSFNRAIVPLVYSEDQTDLPVPVSIEPELEGSGEWVTSSLYVFTPADGMAGGETYTVDIKDELKDFLNREN